MPGYGLGTIVVGYGKGEDKLATSKDISAAAFSPSEKAAWWDSGCDWLKRNRNVKYK